MSLFAAEFKKRLHAETDKPYFQALLKEVASLRKSSTVYPKEENVFRALAALDYNDVKVVILGQDPYHGEGQAIGLSFAVPNSEKIPPSLRNIFEEIRSEFGEAPTNKDLSGWVKQGVLLLNTTLTVEQSKPASHQGKGWETFTDAVIASLNERKAPIVFLLWGRHAHEKTTLITNPAHLVLTAPHPSPFSAHKGFFGCDHFKKANAFLEKNALEPIDWVKA